MDLSQENMLQNCLLTACDDRSIQYVYVFKNASTKRHGGKAFGDKLFFKSDLPKHKYIRQLSMKGNQP